MIKKFKKFSKKFINLNWLYWLKKLKNYQESALMIIAVVLLILLISVYFMFFHSPQVLAEWFNINWHYRALITITNSGSAQTNTQVKVLSNYDMSSNISNGKLQSDLDDLRFTDVAGKVLKYWIEDSTNTSVDVWVFLPSAPTSQVTIFMYYGNPSAGAGKSTLGTSNYPGISCEAIRLSGVSTNGIYYVDTDGEEVSNAFQSYCDLNTNGGGWDLVMNLNTEDSSAHPSWNTGYREDSSYGSIASALANDYKNQSIWNSMNSDYIMITNHKNGTNKMYYSYEFTATYKSKAMLWMFQNVQRQQVTNTYNASWGTGNTDLDRDAMTQYGAGYLLFNFTYSNNAMRIAPSNQVLSGAGVNDDKTRGLGSAFATSPNDDISGTDGSWNAQAAGFSGVPNGGGAYRGVGLYLSGDNCNCGSSLSSGESTSGGTTGLKAYHYGIWLKDTSFSNNNLSNGSPSTEESGTGPIAYWRFNEGYGTTINDTTSNNKNGTITNALWRTEDFCISGKCLFFDGTGDYVSINYDYGAVIGTGDFSFSYWFKTTDSSNDRMTAIMFGREGNNGFRVNHNYPGAYEIHFEVEPNGGDGGSFNIEDNSLHDGRWHHISGVRDSGTIYLYIDGQSVGTPNTATASLDGTYAETRIGHQPGSGARYFNGFIDEVKIFNRAQTPAQVKADYLAGRSGLAKGAAGVMGVKKFQGDVNLSDGLVGYWKMDESSWTNDCVATSIIDSSGSGNNGKACPATTGPTGGAVGKFGKAGSFDGANDYVSIINNNSSLALTQVTVSAWVKSTDSTGGKYIVYKNQNGVGTDNSDNYNIILTGGLGRFAMEDASNGDDYIATGTTNIADGAWHHLVGTYDNNILRVYIDGVEEGTNTPGLFTPYQGSGPLQIGSNSLSNHGIITYTNATIDEVRVYNRALSAREVRLLYEWAPGPVGHWKMDEKTGTTAYDTSGNQYNGTITSATWAPGKYGGGLSFDGNGDYLSISDTSDLDLSDNLTLSAWVKNSTQSSNKTDYKILVIYQGASGHRLEDKYVAEGYDVTVDTGATNLTAVQAYDPDIVVCDKYVWGCSYSFLNTLYDNGYSIFSAGNDTTATIYPTATSASTSITAGTIVPDEKHPLTNGWSSTGGSGGDGRRAISAIHSAAFSIAKDQTNGWIEVIYLEEPNKGRWVHHQPSASPSTALFDNANEFLLRDSLINKGKNYNLFTSMGNLYGFVNAQKLSTSVNYNSWQQATLKYDSANIYLYLNGIQQSSSAYSTVLDTDNTNLYLGSYLNGTADDVRIYNYARTQKQIIEDMQGGRPGQTRPIAYWKFDEGADNTCSGGTNDVCDSSGYGNDGANNGADWTNAGKFGKALNFVSANSDYVDTGDLSSTIDPTKAFTVELWANINQIANDNVVFSTGEYATQRGFVIQFHTGNIKVTHAGTGDYADSTSSYVANRWYHIVAIYRGDGLGAELYLDGINQTKNSYVTNFDTATKSSIGRIDRTTTDLFFNGLIDEVKIYNFALTEDDIRAEYNRGQVAVMGSTRGSSATWDDGGFGGNAPIAEWKFDEKTGTSAYDTSENENIGTITGATWQGSGYCKYGSCLNFNGSNQVVKKTSGVSPATTTDLTVSMWVKPESNTGGYKAFFAANQTGGNDYTTGIDIDMTGGSSANFDRINVEGAGDTGGALDLMTSSFSFGTWHHISIVSTVGTNGIKLYVDGKLEGQRDRNSSTIYLNEIRIGARYYSASESGYLDGSIDQVKIYNYGRTPAQVAYDYNKGKPVGHWRFDEGEGGTVYDDSLNNNDGTITIGSSGSQTQLGSVKIDPGDGTSAWYNGRQGKQNYSLNFDGTNDYLRINPSGGMQLTQGTICMWVKPVTDWGTDNNRQELLQSTSGTGGWWFVKTGNDIGWITYNRIAFRISGATSGESYSGYLDPSGWQGEWQHVCAAWDVTSTPNSNQMYHNGAPCCTSWSNNAVGTPNITQFDISTSDQPIDGQVDDVRIYNYPLTADQIKQVYNFGAARLGTGN